MRDDDDDGLVAGIFLERVPPPPPLLLWRDAVREEDELLRLTFGAWGAPCCDCDEPLFQNCFMVEQCTIN